MAADTLSKAFWRSVEQHGEKPALLVKREKQYRPITYTELGRRVYAFARALHELGVRKGDRVAILAENCPEWAITDWATLCLGAITVPIYPTLTAPQVSEILRDSEPKVLVVSDKKQRRKACEAVEGTGLNPQMICIEPDSGGETPSFEQMLNQPGALTESELRALVDASQPDDIITFIYTSGTTGESKGAMLTHHNLITKIAGNWKMHLTPSEGAARWATRPPLHAARLRLAGACRAQYTRCARSPTPGLRPPAQANAPRP